MQNNKKMRKKTEQLPLLPLRGLLAYPNMLLHFDVGRDKSISALERAMEEDRQLIVVAQRDAMKENPHIEDMYGVGTVVHIKQIVKRPDSSLSVLVEGKSRAFLLGVLEAGDMQLAELERFDSQSLKSTPEFRVRMDMLKQAFQRYAKVKGNIPSELRQSIEGDDNADTLTDMIAANVIRDFKKKQEILETRDALVRMANLEKMVIWECEYIVVEKRIHEKVHEDIDKHQKEYYLREQMQAIRDELGDDEKVDIDRYTRELKKTPMNTEAYARVEKEIDRLSKMPAQSPESVVSRNYIEYMLELPWGKTNDARIDIKRAARVLDADHFGLKSVKTRILEYLAVRQLTEEASGSILCLVGPPGVGKTSIARSVARSMKRDFSRLSLGGMHDEAELRGHRRTYIGAMPGRVISNIKQSGSMNPVFLFDEIDKLASDMRGDPAAAMLEILDPEQNATFRDNFLEVPFDLSRVFFITTANTTDGIPRPLLDRMEIIEVASYTLEEKTQIAKRHLWPKQLKKHGLKPDQVKIGAQTIVALIDGYTREAGVRELERSLGAICRKVAVKVMEAQDGEKMRVTIGLLELEEYLGVRKYGRMKTLKKPEIGVVNGLAWTSVGGETLAIEAAVMPGGGAVDLTGHLGDVMKESARTALSYIRSTSIRLDIPEDFYKNVDIHIHVPEGATPKDGPSAGVAMTCAMVSAITGKPARQDIAMTGEVTLRGRVLPIGGVKEKLLAAYRMGIGTILLPEENEKDLEELPVDVRSKMDIRTIANVDQAIRCVLS